MIFLYVAWLYIVVSQKVKLNKEYNYKYKPCVQIYDKTKRTKIP